MKKSHIVGAALWGYLGLYGWNLYAGLAGIDWLWGPLLAASLIALIAADQMRRSWAARETAATATGSATVAQVPAPDLA